MKKIIFLFGFILISYLVYSLLGPYLNFSSIKNEHLSIQLFFQKNPIIFILGYSFVYVLITSLSLPGATILSLFGSSVMGFFWGLITISISSTIGACISFLVSRFFLAEWFNKKFFAKISTINDGFEKNGKYYLFALRMIPLFPFFLVNIAMGITSIKLKDYALISWIGMLPGTILYVNAGGQIGKISSSSEIMSVSVILSLSALGLFPLIMKKLWKMS